MRPNGVITLTTDFGLSDAYVGAMKGVILGINPHAKIVDITHEVQPQQIEQGAFLLSSALPYFPAGTVHIAVVDPGVGTDRHALALVTPMAMLVGPDNGLLAVAIPEDFLADAAGQVDLPLGYKAYHITNEALFRTPVSATFHGRDIFAPVAAHLSRGFDVSRLGPSTTTIKSLRPLRATFMPDGSVQGRIIQIDRFGNLISNIRREQISPSPVIQIAGYKIAGLVETYQQGEGLMALIGSSGYLEIAMRDGGGAAVLGAKIGTPVIIRRDS